MKTIIAIDPGAGGGIAYGTSVSNAVCMSMPETEGDIIDRLSTITSNAGGSHNVIAYMEDVGTGVMPGRALAMIPLNVNAAVCRTVFACIDVRTVKFRPRVWQKPLGLGTRSACASDSEWKNKLKSEAQRRFPGLKVTLKTADALLILDYAFSHAGS